MIFDHVSRIATYRSLSNHLARAIDFVQSTDLKALPTGRYEVDGERVYALVFEYETSIKGTARWESHRKYIDLQLLIAGEEKILVADIATLHGPGAYDAAKDVMFYESGESPVPTILGAGQFTILFPHDGHRATLAPRDPGPIRKVVLKIAVE